MARQASKEFYLDTGDGHKIFAATYGPVQETPLLLIHGGAGYTLDIDRLPLPKDRHIIVMHQRGMGKSLPAGTTHKNTIDANISDIERLREYLQIREMDLFAWSFGAVYMAGYAFKHPHRCKSLTAYAPYFGSDEDYQSISSKDTASAQAYYQFHDGTSGKDITHSAFNKASNPDFNKRFQAYHAVFNLAARRQIPERELLQTKTLQEWKALFGIRHAHAALDHELFHGKKNFLKECAVPLPCPVTLIHGEDDVWSAPTKYAETLFPGHKSLIIKGAGHDIHEVAGSLLPPESATLSKPSAIPS